MAWLFGSTLFVSAALLFWVQPLLAKMLLPFLGGSPGVWNTCMVFFQGLLLLGYGYAHLSARAPQVPAKIIHLVLLLGGLLMLPFSLSENRIELLAQGGQPQAWLLTTLLVMVGLPFFILSTTGPLLQAWFAKAGFGKSRDPYFLYAASNAGSLLTLLGYPLLIEPQLRLRTQSHWWWFGYLGLIALVTLCGLVVVRNPGSKTPPVEDEKNFSLEKSEELPPGWRRRLAWVFFAFVPSSLMLGVTHYLATDIASIPLLFVVPLALYLLTFILIFARKEPMAWPGRFLPFVAVALVFLMMIRATQPVWMLIFAHLLFYFLAAMVCHGRLAEDRPSPRHLTEFYLLMSLGGVLGGIFNALLAPQIFKTVAEYPLMIVVACLIGGLRNSAPRFVLMDLALPFLTGIFAFSIALIIPVWVEEIHWRNLIIGGLPAVLAFFFAQRPLRFGLSLGAILLAGSLGHVSYGKTIFIERNFFGVSRVVLEPSGKFHRMVHGNTTHGRQFLDPERACEPLTYYHRKGPLGDVFEAFNPSQDRAKVAVIGLGSGSMMSYALGKDDWTFYEIDPTVIKIAQDKQFFTYLSECRRASMSIVAGDGRLMLQKAGPHAFDLIVLDAFSSDAIPVHLLTLQALELYLSKLRPEGFLAFHISNRYLDLRPVVGHLAARMRLCCYGWDDASFSVVEGQEGKEESHWVVMARQPSHLGTLLRHKHWTPIPGSLEARVWEDDFSNILSVLKWN